MGSGAGYNAYYLKKYFQIDLVDISQQMLNISKKLNPDLNHYCGDMRSIKISKKYDAIFIHDAIVHITNLNDLKKVLRTISSHLKPNGCILIVPDYFKETFRSSSIQGGYDDFMQGLRYLQWTIDSNPRDSVVECYTTYMLRDALGNIKVENDFYQIAVFSIDKWKELLSKEGFKSDIRPIAINDMEPGVHICIFAEKC
nr:class I SAM-dependent methyltransferase [Anaerobacterium chartisolvens]